MHKLINNLSQGTDDRCEIITFHNPGEFHMGCLRPCMHTHAFSLLDDKLYLTSYQRSCDVPLCLNFNQIQVFFLLKIIAQITGNKASTAFHKIVNVHIYEDQLNPMRDVQLKRIPFKTPSLHINPNIKTLKNLETWVTLDYFEVLGYRYHKEIKYLFAV